MTPSALPRTDSPPRSAMPCRYSSIAATHHWICGIVRCLGREGAAADVAIPPSKWVLIDPVPLVGRRRSVYSLSGKTPEVRFVYMREAPDRPHRPRLTVPNRKVVVTAFLSTMLCPRLRSGRVGSRHRPSSLRPETWDTPLASQLPRHDPVLLRRPLGLLHGRCARPVPRLGLDCGRAAWTRPS